MNTAPYECPNSTRNSGLRVGVSLWTPASPLLLGLASVSGVYIEQGSPATIVAGFESGELDCALMPTLDGLCQESCKLVPGVGIASEGTTPTERILTAEWPWKGGRMAYPKDTAGLVAPAILLMDNPAEFVQREDPTECPHEMDGAIATAGFPLHCDRWRHNMDVGIMWRQKIGLPLVHMLWVARRGARLPELRRILAYALQHAIEQTTNSPDAGRTGFSYRIGSAEVDGLRVFRKMAIARGLCPASTDLAFC